MKNEKPVGKDNCAGHDLSSSSLSDQQSHLPWWELQCQSDGLGRPSKSHPDNHAQTREWHHITVENTRQLPGFQT